MSTDASPSLADLARASRFGSLDRLAQASGIELSFLESVDIGEIDPDPEFLEALSEFIPGVNRVAIAHAEEEDIHPIIRGESPTGYDLEMMEASEIDPGDLISYLPKTRSGSYWTEVVETSVPNGRLYAILTIMDHRFRTDIRVSKNQPILIARAVAE